jgi:hypothetical protein
MYSIYNIDTGDLIARGQPFPRPGMIESVRRDPTNLVPNCPDDLKGPNGERYGWIKEIKVNGDLSPDQLYGDPIYGDPDFDAGTIEVVLLRKVVVQVDLNPGEVYGDPVYGEPDLVTNTVTVTIPARDRTPSEIEQKKAQLKQSVNQERDRRWPGTVNCDLAGDGSLVIPADARNDTDLRNIQAVTTTAQVVAGTPDAVLKFRDANDITHNLSPEEVITLGLIVQAHVQSFYEKAWVLKDSIDSMTSVELDAIDVRNNSHWGITNVSSSADSI